MDRGANVRAGPPDPGDLRGTNGIWARVCEIALGAWLFASAFAFGESGAAHTDALLLGALAFCIGIASLLVPTLRWLNMALSVVLFLTCWAFAHASAGALWNGLLIAVAIFCLSIVPSVPLARLGQQHYAEM
jgi:hypothetical protein